MIKLVLLFIFSLILYPAFSQEQAELSFEELDSLIGVTLQQGDFESMLQYAEKGAELALKENNSAPNTLYTSYITYMGLSYEYLGLHDQSYKHYNKSKELLEQLVGTEDPLYAEALTNLGAYYWTVPNYEKAEPLYLEAQKICRNSIGENNETFANIQNDLALLYHSMGEYEEAEILYLKNLEYDKRTLGEQSYNYAYSLNNLASLYWTMGQSEKAEPLFIQAREIWGNLTGKESADYAITTNNLANLYMQKGQYTKAAKLYSEVLQIEKAIYGKNNLNYALSLSNSASCYSEIHAYSKAEDAYLQAQKIWLNQHGPLHHTQVKLLADLSVLYTKMKAYSKAKFCLKKALQISKKGSVNYNSSTLLLHKFADFYYHINQQDSAFAYGIACLVYNTKRKHSLSDMFPENIQDFELTDSLISFCQQLRSKDLLQFEKLEYQETGLLSPTFISLLDITKSKYKELVESGFKEKAKKYLLFNYHLAQMAVRSNEATLRNFSENEDKLNIIRGNVIISTFGMDAAKLLGEEKYIRDAFMFTEQNKSILLAGAFQGEKAQVMMNLPDSIAQQEAYLKEQKDILQKEQYQATSPEIISALRSQQNHLNLTINDFLKMIEKEYPKYHALKYKNIISTAQDIQESLDPKTALLEYFITDSITFLFTITSSHIDIIPIKFPKQIIEKKTKILRKALTNYKLLSNAPSLAYKNYTIVAHWFYKNLVAPALQDPSLENLIIITDGALGHIPFEVFLSQYTQTKTNYDQLDYLINDYNISYSYSATLWKENLKMPKKINNNQILACAPDYYSIDSSLLDLRSFYDFKVRSTLQALPSAIGEVQTLSKDFEGLFLIGGASTETHFKKVAADYGIIHLAMHGILHRRQPILSSLAFTEDDDSLENNFLQAYEIAHLKLNADLVVLSACETGYGEFEQGEGILSLARSFMYAGTPSLIVSLWQVNDQSTAIIMQHFYTYLSNGFSKDRALSQAKLDYIKDATGFAGHPAFWSPFIQLGDASPIQLKTKHHLPSWGIPLIVVLSLIGLLLLLLRFKKNKESAVST